MLQYLQIFSLWADYLQNADVRHICSADYRYLQIWQKFSIGCSLEESNDVVTRPWKGDQDQVDGHGDNKET